MKKEELISLLERYNHWRCGADVPMPRPKDLSIAIEAVIAVLNGSDEDVVNFILRDYEFSNNVEL